MTMRMWLGPLTGTIREFEEEEDRPVKLMSKFSNTVAFNTLQIPNVTLTGNYNHYEQRELDAPYCESQDLKDWAQAPMYVKVEWQPVLKLKLAPAGPTTFHGISIKGFPPLADVHPINSDVAQNPLVIIKK